jgi:hypothetical protein
MAVLLNRSYAGLLAGTVTAMLTSVEAALVAQGLASASTKANVTPGNVTANLMSGTVAIPAGANSVTITNQYIDTNTKVSANIAQVAADGTLTSLPRVVPAAGSVTIYGNANATAAVIVDWVILATPGLTVAN